MIVVKDFFLRENKAKYNAGDIFPRDIIASERLAELTAKGYIKGGDDAMNVDDKQEEGTDAETETESKAKSTKKTSSTRKRTKKG